MDASSNKRGPIEEVIMGEVEGFRFITKKSHYDRRGCLQKVFSKELLTDSGLTFECKESFMTISKKNVFRGLHLQFGCHSAAKIISVIQGNITEIVADLRRSTEEIVVQSFEVSEKSDFSFYIPEGVAHGYIVNSDSAIISYLQNQEFCEKCDTGVNGKGILAKLGLLSESLILSDRDNDLPNQLMTQTKKS